MPNVIILKGLPASGKSTWAMAWVSSAPERRMRVNKDDIRAQLHNAHHSAQNEPLVVKAEEALILTGLASGRDVVVDSTNLKPVHERRIRKLVAGRATVEIKEFDTDLATCLARNATRKNTPGYVPPQRIAEMAEQWGHWRRQRTEVVPDVMFEPFYVHDPALAWAVICDVDGTLAHNNGHRGYYEYNKVSADLLHDHVACVLRVLSGAGDKIILVSGRDDSCLDATLDWALGHRVPVDEVHMRRTGDFRKDALVKYEIFRDKIYGRYNIRFVLDDRQKVVDMWRGIGLSCWQVAPGDF